MSCKKAGVQPAMIMIISFVAILVVNCLWMAPAAHAQLEAFANEIQDRMWLDVQHFWDNVGPEDIAAREELNRQASNQISNGLNDMLDGQNLDPGQRYVWRCSGVGGFTLHYPRPDYPAVSVTRVDYARSSSRVVFSVHWQADWTGLSHAEHNGPYIYFRITGGYLWSRRRDVRIHIDRMNMTTYGNSFFIVRNDGTVSSMNFRAQRAGRPGPSYSIRYENPNTYGWRERVGNRIIAELESNYAGRIRWLVYRVLLEDFMLWRMGEENMISGDGVREDFWQHWADWARGEADASGTFMRP